MANNISKGSLRRPNGIFRSIENEKNALNETCWDFFSSLNFEPFFGYIFDYAINQIILINGCDEVKNPFQIFISFITRHWKNIIIEDHLMKIHDSLPLHVSIYGCQRQ